MKKYVLVIFLLSVNTLSYGQRVEEFIELAKKNNPGLESLRLNYNAAVERGNQVSDYPDPTVSLGLGVLPVETRLGSQLFRLGVSQAIPWKGLLDTRKELASAKAEIFASADEVKEIDIAFNIRISYSKLLFLEDQIAIIENKLALMDLLEELATSSVRSGQGKLSNVLIIQRTRESLQSDRRLIEKQREGPTIIINRWSGRPLYDSIELVQILPSVNDIEAFFKFAEKDHPYYDIINQKITTSEKTANLTDLERKPKLGVGIEYAWIDGRNDVTNLPGNGRDVLMPMGSISIPLHTDRYDSKRQEEKIVQESLEAQRRDIQEMYQAEITAALSKLELANLEIEKYAGLKDITGETLELMRSEYASEGTRFEELLRLELELIDYDLMISKARYEELLADATLQKFQ